MLCCGGRLQECIVRLEKEINLEYDRTMNRISFDRVVLTNPEDFSHITLPQREPEHVPQNGEFTGGRACLFEYPNGVDVSVRLLV